MGKRVSLNDEDVELIIAALRLLHDSSILNPKAYPKYALASKQRINQIGKKIGFGEVRA